jgi:hypothetical protein
MQERRPLPGREPAAERTQLAAERLRAWPRRLRAAERPLGDRLQRAAVQRRPRAAWPQPDLPGDARQWRGAAAEQPQPATRLAEPVAGPRQRRMPGAAAEQSSAEPAGTPRQAGQRWPEGRALLPESRQRAPLQQRGAVVRGVRRLVEAQVERARHASLPGAGSQEWPWRRRRAWRRATSRSLALARLRGG